MYIVWQRVLKQINQLNVFRNNLIILNFDKWVLGIACIPTYLFFTQSGMGRYFRKYWVLGIIPIAFCLPKITKFAIFGYFA